MPCEINWHTCPSLLQIRCYGVMSVQDINEALTTYNELTYDHEAVLYAILDLTELNGIPKNIMKSWGDFLKRVTHFTKPTWVLIAVERSPARRFFSSLVMQTFLPDTAYCFVENSDEALAILPQQASSAH